MGLFDAIKGVVKSATGTWADLTLSTNPAARGRKMAVTVNVSVRADPIDPSRVYIGLRCKEEVEIKGYSVPVEQGQPAKTIDVKKDEWLLDKKITIAPGQHMDASSHHTINGEVDIPADMPASFKGKNARVTWYATAALELPANNPDSGWKEIVVT